MDGIRIRTYRPGKLPGCLRLIIHSCPPRSACRHRNKLLLRDRHPLKSSQMVIAKQKLQLLACRFGRKKRTCCPDAILREPIPKFLRFVKLNQRLRELFRLIRHQNVLAIAKVCSLHSNRSGDYRYSKSHTLIYLSFNTGAESQRRDGQSDALEKWTRVSL